jgi:hypothetical protein
MALKKATGLASSTRDVMPGFQRRMMPSDIGTLMLLAPFQGTRFLRRLPKRCLRRSTCFRAQVAWALSVSSMRRTRASIWGASCSV